MCQEVTKTKWKEVELWKEGKIQGMEEKVQGMEEEVQGMEGKVQGKEGKVQGRKEEVFHTFQLVSLLTFK